MERMKRIVHIQADSSVQQRHGFALLITLSVLIIVIALTGVLTGYLDEARKDADQSRALVQANLYYADLKSFLTKFKDKEALYSILYASPIPLAAQEGDFSLTLSCRPFGSGLDIRWLGADANASMQSRYRVTQKVFDALVQRYELSDPVELEEMIVNRVQQRDDPVTQAHLRQNNGIISYTVFQDILMRYEMKTGDEHVRLVPWKSLFSFPLSSTERRREKLAGNYLSVPLLSLLFDLDEAEVKASWTEGKGALKHLAETYGIDYDSKLFSDTFVNTSRCEVAFDYRRSRFMFAFNDIEGEVKDFEFYGKQ